MNAEHKQAGALDDLDATALAQAQTPQPGYMPGLDVLRGLAILLVMVDHGLSADGSSYTVYHSTFMLWLRGVFQMGRMGVHLFFILSGFLITGILLNTRADTDYYKNFYYRRVLRILPAYLLMLVVLICTGSITWRYVAVCLLYLCNMNGLLRAGPEYGPFWSLSVEEQFYLVWPFAVRRLSLRHLTNLALALIVGTPVLRFILHYGPKFLHDISNKPWVLGDFFAAGALLCIASRAPNLRPKLQQFVWPMMIAGAALIAVYLLLPAPVNPLLLNLRRAVELEPWLLFFSGLMLFAWLHPGMAFRFWARPFVFLGKISYGLYLCHLFIFRSIDGRWTAGGQQGLGPLPRTVLRFVVESTAAIAIAALSRYTFEEFFLRLKPKHHHKPISHNVS